MALPGRNPLAEENVQGSETFASFFLRININWVGGGNLIIFRPNKATSVFIPVKEEVFSAGCCNSVTNITLEGSNSHF